MKISAAFPLVLALSCTDATVPLDEQDKSDGPQLAAGDITFLYPLPKGDVESLTPELIASLPAALEAAGYVLARSAGPRGELVPASIQDALPPGVVSSMYPATVVVGVRVDPCAPVEDHCEPELRLVLQMIIPGSPMQGQPLHAIYRLSVDDREALVADLRALKAAHDAPTDGAPVGVHPLLAPLGECELGAEGCGSLFARELRDVLLRYMGAANLMRVAVRDFGLVGTVDAEGQLVGSPFFDERAHPPEQIEEGPDAGRVRVWRLAQGVPESYVTDGLFAVIPSCRVPISDPSTADDYVAFGTALLTFDIVDGSPVPGTIPRLGEHEESHCQLITGAGASDAISPEGIDMAPLPWPALDADEDIAPVFNRGAVGDETRKPTPGELGAAADRVLDPGAHDVRNVDCASCHLAPLARHWVGEHFPDELAPSATSLARAPGVLPFGPSFTCLGHEPFGPVVCDRVLLETERSLAWLAGSR